MKEVNYRVGALKRKYKMGAADFEPGTLINKLKESQVPAVKEESAAITKVSIAGLI